MGIDGFRGMALLLPLVIYNEGVEGPPERIGTKSTVGLNSDEFLSYIERNRSSFISCARRKERMTVLSDFEMYRLVEIFPGRSLSW